MVRRSPRFNGLKVLLRWWRGFGFVEFPLFFPVNGELGAETGSNCTGASANQSDMCGSLWHSRRKTRDFGAFCSAVKSRCSHMPETGRKSLAFSGANSEFPNCGDGQRGTTKDWTPYPPLRFANWNFVSGSSVSRCAGAARIWACWL